MNLQSSLRLALLQLACLCLSSIVSAQERVRVEARVTAISTGNVFIDRGLEAGLREDDEVTIDLDTGFTSIGRIVSVTRAGARIELAPGSVQPAVGARASIMISPDRLKPDENGHRPWEAQNPAWDPNRPLLAPAFGTKPSERESVTTGQVYLRLAGTLDQQSDSKYSLASLGLDLRRTNPFGSGGEFFFSGEVFTRTNDISGQPNDTSTDSSLRRFSYRVGGEEDNPTRWEFGRFLQHEFPELGLLDGAEWTQKTASGSEYGASFGWMPEPFPTLPSGDDMQAAIYYRWVADRERKLVWGNAYENTWHKGEQDRNLFLSTLDWIMSRAVSLHAIAWVDYYGPNDTIKPDGFELTELSGSVTWRTTERSSVNFNASHRRYPEMLRSESATLTDTQILDNHVERFGGGWSSQLGTYTRVSARADWWEDQSDNGQNYDASIGWRDLFWERGELTLTGNYTAGTYSSGPGGRVSATKAWDGAFGTLTYSFANYDQKDINGNAATVANQSVFGSVDLALGKAWDLSIYTDYRFGDNLDTYDLGVNLTMRF